uniref:Glutamine synthetase n=1 Tax=Chromera velia CCMP2878 TaxID=1169474 RepID=A0A0G4HCR7_9ALVE|mmetsp:Transcript_14591/g.29355  ORF Transcript_14591/g.29355 Transcript_14591/m.29355 type:complete len:480 (-) Transcript_14591:1646-3085(-)|eukprot:Cvel_26302.t1-p1 / transcript=Cvel_26302.t1 / gene=Cvel_26302 / organism=Chromera_velia_CCMP2878 / gene_product=Glutamine synthetase, putative / transcript_product=Glutamine synthetase, putative / location=Cvel_scaffold3105:10313-15659(+) / protein_length=479 / sequence_SO=supercontig / SO=protein_coding / is_pseudo=false
MPFKGLPFKSEKDMADYIVKEGVELVDAVFTDPIGVQHHCTFAASECKEDDLKDGFAFDGSSIRLFKSIEKSDMVMKPDITTCFIDPFWKAKVMRVTCTIFDNEGNPFDRDPRAMCAKAKEYLKSTGLGDQVFFGPEPEFFVFDSVKFCAKPNKIMMELTGEDAPFSMDADHPNIGHRLNHKQFYFPTAPIDPTHDLRSEMLLTMGKVGLPIEKHHHEVAACQSELGIAFDEMVHCADNVMVYKYCVKMVAKKYGKVATFMPKPLFGDNGTGMHVHQSIWKGGTNTFFDEKGAYCKLSAACMHYIGGLLTHAPSVLAFSNPSVNSYKRLVPGYEAPTNLVFSKGNRSAAVRIPLFRGDNPKAKRLEFRCPDPSCCPYLAFAAMLMAGIDGIKNKISPGEPADFDIFEMSAEEKAAKGMRSTPQNLLEVSKALEGDHDFLLQGDVFKKDFIEAYIEYKKTEFITCDLVPNPKEFEMYFSC